MHLVFKKDFKFRKIPVEKVIPSKFVKRKFLLPELKAFAEPFQSEKKLLVKQYSINQGFRTALSKTFP
jgi:hypothetical protein